MEVEEGSREGAPQKTGGPEGPSSYCHVPPYLPEEPLTTGRKIGSQLRQGHFGSDFTGSSSSRKEAGAKDRDGCLRGEDGEKGSYGDRRSFSSLFCWCQGPNTDLILVSRNTHPAHCVSTQTSQMDGPYTGEWLETVWKDQGRQDRLCAWCKCEFVCVSISVFVHPCIPHLDTRTHTHLHL